MIAENLDVEVVRIVDEATDIRSFELVGADGATLPGFSAGSHIDVSLPNGLTRQYSLCNDPGESHRYLIGVLRDAGSLGGSKSMHDDVRVGQRLRISAPRNHFALARDGRSSLLLAGGIGITPILCMAERLAVMGADFELHYCARSRNRMAFVDRIMASTFASRAHLHLDDQPETALDMDALLANAPEGRHLYVCGPGGFIEAVLGKARAAGWPESRLHCKFFKADAAPTGDEGSFRVRLANSGRVIDVPADQTVLQALGDAGVVIPSSCEQGVCGTCLTRVLDGEPEHRDVFLTPDEQAANDQFLPCCSRSKSPVLVLDL